MKGTHVATDLFRLRLIKNNMWTLTMIAALLLIVSATAAPPPPPPRGRTLKVPKVYNALITSDLPLIPSRAEAETSATAAVGPVLLYSSELPVVLQAQSPPPTQHQHQHLLHLQKLQQAQNHLQLQRDADDVRQAQFQRELQQQRHPVKVQQLPPPELPAQQLLSRHQQQLPARHQQQLFPQYTRQQYSHKTQYLQYQQQVDKSPLQQQPYPQIDYVRQQDIEQQLQAQQKQLQQQQLFEAQQRDTSYLPMPQVSSYQPPPSVHIDEIKNNKPPNAAIPDVPPPPLPVGKRLQPYHLSPPPPPPPPPPTSHHVPYG